MNNTIDHIKSANLSFDDFDDLLNELEVRTFSKGEVLAVAQEFRLASAKTKKQAISKMRDMLVDLKATAEKSRMYR